MTEATRRRRKKQRKVDSRSKNRQQRRILFFSLCLSEFSPSVLTPVIDHYLIAPANSNSSVENVLCCAAAFHCSLLTTLTADYLDLTWLFGVSSGVLLILARGHSTQCPKPPWLHRLSWTDWRHCLLSLYLFLSMCRMCRSQVSVKRVRFRRDEHKNTNTERDLPA